MMDRIGKVETAFRSLGDYAMGHVDSPGRLLSTLLAANRQFRTRPNPRAHGRGPQACNGQRHQIWPQAKAIGLPMGGSHKSVAPIARALHRSPRTMASPSR